MGETRSGSTRTVHARSTDGGIFAASKFATVYHFGIREENGQCFCAMELVEGETLETRVRRTGPLDALTTIDIALQVSSALAAAEKQGLVHRDLKPANLMLVARRRRRQRARSQARREARRNSL